MDIKAMQEGLQQFSSMIMRMMQQDRYIEGSSASWLERSLKQYDAQEKMTKRLQDYGLNKDIALAVAKSVIKGSEDMDRPGLESIDRLGQAGIGEAPGVSLPQPTVDREEVIAPTIDSLRDIVKQFLPENPEMQEGLVNLMMTKGSDEALSQMTDYTKITEAEKERVLKEKAQKLTGEGLRLRGEELAYEKTGTEKVDKTITKIESLREKRSALMDKMSPTAMSAWFGNTTKSEKNIIKHILSLNRDIKRYKGAAKGYDDPDQVYADAAKEVKNSGATKEFIMKILLGKELDPRETTAKDILKGYLNEQGLSLPILMEYF